VSGRVPVRGGSHLRRGPTVRRASARVSLTRVAAVLVLLGASFALARANDASAFPIRAIEIEGAQLIERPLLEAALLAAGGQGNVFRYDTAAAAAALARLPAVRTAHVRAVLPDHLVATIEERVPVIAWALDDGRFFVDGEGLLFARVLSGGAPGVPSLSDLRAASADLAVGSRISAVELGVARQLAALTPTVIGSAAGGLVVSVTGTDGFTVSSTGSPAWVAVFGLYGEVTRSAEIVPLQVQCLASLLADQGEGDVGRIVLSPEGQSCGTFGAP